MNLLESIQWSIFKSFWDKKMLYQVLFWRTSINIFFLIWLWILVFSLFFVPFLFSFIDLSNSSISIKQPSSIDSLKSSPTIDIFTHPSTSWYTVFDVVQSPPLSSPPCKFGKILVVDHFIENFRIKNYFKKDFLNFSYHYVRYCNNLVTFLEKFPHQFAFTSSQSS